MNRFARLADPWRIHMPVLRYLRNSPLRTLRERMWFVSRLQPNVSVTVNLTRNVRNEPGVIRPATVLLRQWLTARTATVEVRREEARAAAIPPAPAALSPLARRTPKRVIAEPAAVVIRVAKPVRVEAAVLQPEISTVLVSKLAGRMKRIDDITPPPETRVVRRIPAATPTESIATPRAGELPGEPGRPFAIPAPAFASTQHTAPSSMVNVDHLTEQIIKQLDRRLIASRERLGRI
jgi:hypothetical protein